jgi:hypothetical protein
MSVSRVQRQFLFMIVETTRVVMEIALSPSWAAVWTALSPSRAAVGTALPPSRAASIAVCDVDDSWDYFRSITTRGGEKHPLHHNALWRKTLSITTRDGVIRHSSKSPCGAITSPTKPREGQALQRAACWNHQDPQRVARWGDPSLQQVALWCDYESHQTP